MVRMEIVALSGCSRTAISGRFVRPQVCASRYNAHIPTLWGRLLNIIAQPQPQSPAQLETQGSRELPARRRHQAESIVELSLTLTPDLKVNPALAEQLLLSFNACQSALSFELIGLSEAVSVQWACRSPDQTHVTAQLKAYFPDCFIAPQTGFLATQWQRQTGAASVVVDFGLHTCLAPLAMVRSFEPDPLTSLVGSLAQLQQNELAVVQVLFQSVRHPWATQLRGLLLSNTPIFDPVLTAQSKEKMARPLFAAVIRVAAQSQTETQTWEIVRRVGRSLAQLSNPSYNELLALSNEGYERAAHTDCLLSRTTCRNGMLLNSAELASLAHLPSASVQIAKLKRDQQRTKAVPAIALNHELVLGHNLHQGKSQTVTLSPTHRSKHIGSCCL